MQRVAGLLLTVSVVIAAEVEVAVAQSPGVASNCGRMEWVAEHLVTPYMLARYAPATPQLTIVGACEPASCTCLICHTRASET